MQVADLVSVLTGRWDVRRSIVDHRAGAVYRFVGSLQLTETAFEEAGVLAMPHGTLGAERRYALRTTKTHVEVAFPDGRPFVSLNTKALQSLRHDCGDDLYRGRLVFRSPDEWVEHWRVAGPAKRYSSLCRYRRARG